MFGFVTLHWNGKSFDASTHDTNQHQYLEGWWRARRICRISEIGCLQCMTYTIDKKDSVGACVHSHVLYITGDMAWWLACFGGQGFDFHLCLAIHGVWMCFGGLLCVLQVHPPDLLHRLIVVCELPLVCECVIVPCDELAPYRVSAPALYPESPGLAPGSLPP